jgi:hypothetical protein
MNTPKVMENVFDNEWTCIRKDSKTCENYRSITLFLKACKLYIHVEVEVTLWLTVIQSICLGVHSETCDMILLPVGRLLSERCGLVSMGHPPWPEDGPVVCSAVTQWSESHRTYNHTLLSHLRLLQPGRPDSRIYEYVSQEQGGPVIPPGTEFTYM